MAISGLPSDIGPAYPSRADLTADLNPFVSEVNSLGANQGSANYDQLNSSWLTAQGHEATYYNPQQFDPSNPSPVGAKAAGNDIVILTDIPTSSTNYSRPRTLAAGYDKRTQTMTVVFRDGTFYNYYDVKPNEWLNFSASFSKGKPWLNRGFANGLQKMDGLFIGKPRGIADPGQLDPDLARQLYLVASSHQQSSSHQPQESKTHEGRVKGWEGKTGNKPFRSRTGYAPKPRTPKNPSTGGTNPAGRRRRAG